MKLGLSVNNQSVETSGITKDYKEALCEYVWNGFEANATHVELTFTENELGGISQVQISDNGNGIQYETLQDTFGAFLASQKSGLSLQLKSKANKGKGRFSFLSFGTDANWSTVFSSGETCNEYTISLGSVNKNEYDVSDPIITNKPCGTTVTITGISTLTAADVSFDELESVMLKTFAWYLYLNKANGITLSINGREIDYNKYLDVNLSRTETVSIENNVFTVTLIVWVEKLKENFCTYYLDESGVVCGRDTTTFNRNTVNFNHSVFVQSNFFDSQTNITLSDISTAPSEPEQLALDAAETRIRKKLKRSIQKIISDCLNSYMSGQAEKAVHGMIERDSFPRFSSDIYGEMRKQDLITVTKELYRLDSRIFFKLKPVQEKSLLGFLNLLLSSEERENVLSIVEGIVELTPEQRENFANILKRTRLENIIATIKFIEDRYTILEGLKAIVFDYAKYANERDNIQKIIEQHYWLFGEQYHLVTADQRMKKALQEYLYILYGDDAPNASLAPDEEALRRMDIFACGARKTENGFETSIEENLIVELKAPSVVLSKKVLRQVEDYMDFVRKQPQFNSQYRRWKFIAVCCEVDDDVKSRYVAHEAMGKKGLVSKIENYEIYALTWDDVFKSFELSHSFVLDKLKLDRDAIAKELQSHSQSDSERGVVNQITETICAIG